MAHKRNARRDEEPAVQEDVLEHVSKVKEEQTSQENAEAAAETPGGESGSAAETVEAADAQDAGQLAREIAALQEQQLRLRAEYDNYRRRTTQEKQMNYENAKLDTVTAYLPLYDNLLRAASQPCTDEKYAQGVQMLTGQFAEILAKLGVREIPALGETFNPEVHNAISHVEDEALGENEVVEVFAPGFQTEKRVVRLAMVKVAN